jgi:hypothetical protein
MILRVAYLRHAALRQLASAGSHTSSEKAASLLILALENHILAPYILDFNSFTDELLCLNEPIFITRFCVNAPQGDMGAHQSLTFLQ